MASLKNIVAFLTNPFEMFATLLEKANAVLVGILPSWLVSSLAAGTRVSSNDWEVPKRLDAHSDGFDGPMMNPSTGYPMVNDGMDAGGNVYGGSDND